MVLFGRDETTKRSKRLEVATETCSRMASKAKPMLRAGDVIEFYSAAFISGDPRGRRRATIVKIARHENEEYPIRVNRLEMLPLYTRVTRTVDDDGVPCSARWYMLSSFELVDGTADAVFQEQVFNQQAKEAVNEAFGRTGTTEDTESDAEPIALVEERAEHVVDLPVPDAEAAPCTQEQIAKFEELLTEEECRKKQHRAKNRLGLKQRSKRRHHLKLRKPGRDSKAVKHSKSGMSTFLKGFMQQDHVKAALMCLRKERAGSTEAFRETDNTGQLILPPVAVECSTTCTIEPKAPAAWPSDVQLCDKQLNPPKLAFRDIGNLGKCKCDGECYIDDCLNSQSDVYCTKRNCAAGGQCSNAISEINSLHLFDTMSKGFGVYTSEVIEVGTIVGEYCGILEGYEGKIDSNNESVPIKQNSGYSLLLNHRSTDGRFVYIEPKERGSVMRFVNHSCQPNCRFREMQYRTKVTVVVITTRKLKAMEEVTVAYAGKLWFDCTCGSTKCVGKMQQSRET